MGKSSGICPEAIMSLYGGGELEELQERSVEPAGSASGDTRQEQVEEFCFDQKAIVDILSVWLARERGMAMPVKRQGRFIIEKDDRGQPASVMVELTIEPAPNVRQLPRKPARGQE